MLSASPAVCAADELDETEATEDAQPSDLPIAVELAQGIDLLNDQIAKQQELLKTAKSEREHELIRSHIRLLQKERRSLESLLHKLVGPNFEIRETAQEQKSEQRAEQEQKTLERDERFEQP
jgi:hypothetical protein